LPRRSVTDSDHWALRGSDHAMIYADRIRPLRGPDGDAASFLDQWINGGAAMLLFFALVRHFFGVAADQSRHTFRAGCRFRELRDQLQRAGKTQKGRDHCGTELAAHWSLRLVIAVDRRYRRIRPPLLRDNLGLVQKPTTEFSKRRISKPVLGID
jgi:hypothetical protein